MNPVIKFLWPTNDLAFYNIFKYYYQSLMRVLKLKEVLVGMLLDGQALELVHDILQVIPIDGWKVRDALMDAVTDICQHLRLVNQQSFS